MFEPKVIQFGPFMIPSSWIVLLMSILLSVYLFERRTPERTLCQQYVSSQILTVLLIYLLVFKFGPALSRPVEIVKHPLSIVYSTGHEISSLFGICLAAAWLGWHIYKSGRPWPLLDVVALSILATAVVYNFVFRDLGKPTEFIFGWEGDVHNYHRLHVYRFVLLFPLLIWLGWKLPRLQPGLAFSIVFIWLGAVYTVVSLFGHAVNPLYGGLTMGQWIGMIAAFLGWIAGVWRDRGTIHRA